MEPPTLPVTIPSLLYPLSHGWTDSVPAEPLSWYQFVSVAESWSERQSHCEFAIEFTAVSQSVNLSRSDS